MMSLTFAATLAPDAALALAQFQRPGVRLVVGPTDAREEPLQPLPWQPRDWRKSEPETWWQYDLRARLGFIPSPWTMNFACAFMRITGREPSDAEYIWLDRNDGRGADLANAQAWLDAAQNAAVA